MYNKEDISNMIKILVKNKNIVSWIFRSAASKLRSYEFAVDQSCAWRLWSVIQRRAGARHVIPRKQVDAAQST